MGGTVDWAGYRFLPLWRHDGHFLRGPGVFAFARREIDERRTLLFVDHADNIAGVAGAGHHAWGRALGLGMNELHVFLAAKQRIDRLLIRGAILKRCAPVLQADPDQQADWEACWRGVA